MKLILELNDKQLEVLVNALYQFETNDTELYDVADQMRYTIQNMTTMQAVKREMAKKLKENERSCRCKR